MNIRFFNARILTMEEGRKIFSGEVWVSGDRILLFPSGNLKAAPPSGEPAAPTGHGC